MCLSLFWNKKLTLDEHSKNLTNFLRRSIYLENYDISKIKIKLKTISNVLLYKRSLHYPIILFLFHTYATIIPQYSTELNVKHPSHNVHHCMLKFFYQTLELYNKIAVSALIKIDFLHLFSDKLAKHRKIKLKAFSDNLQSSQCGGIIYIYVRIRNGIMR